jgi:hypothetical protein
MVKRIIALEGDWLLVPGAADAQKIPKVHRKCKVSHILTRRGRSLHSLALLGPYLGRRRQQNDQ